MAEEKGKAIPQDQINRTEGELTDESADKVVGGGGNFTDFNITKNTDKSSPTL
jgi:hypothetical protein